MGVLADMIKFNVNLQYLILAAQDGREALKEGTLSVTPGENPEVAGTQVPATLDQVTLEAYAKGTEAAIKTYLNTMVTAVVPPIGGPAKIVAP